MASSILQDIEAVGEAILAAETTGTGSADLPKSTTTGTIGNLNYSAEIQGKVTFTKQGS